MKLADAQILNLPLANSGRLEPISMVAEFRDDLAITAGAVNLFSRLECYI